ncbi:aspartyl/glutamyl-tRNA amidotransferase subunit C [Planctomycetes bacterium Pla163]|uniref:Glutamyl-tRNA(Gln) amidotransferase subunit C n=1 Tax=Rohdeia mirabilis TaxID=2528008 RepID=A0A518D1J8_9BACT|nr:aspartyl/glutamyl-tRNA amidotransferase subunit C [Planctomycetes bacterium Pla163]
MATSDDRRPPLKGTPDAGSRESGAPHPEPSTLRREARLARLALDPQREASLSDDLVRILAAFESLQEVDVSNLEPLHQPLHASLAEPLRHAAPTDPAAAGTSRRDSRLAAPDPTSAVDRARLLEGAPEPIDGHFGVPRTIEQ